MKAFDWPPIWLAAALALVWVIGRALPLPLFGGAARWVGGGLVLGGLVLMATAAAQMRLARTTFIPRRDPSALVTGGVFAFSRNPIYLGDALVLAGAVLWLDVPLALPVVLGFMAIIQARFILGEEIRLRAHFGPQFEAWARKTGRWLGV
ncbi:MAG: isoprenylcysteine carboxylmethyltransferase family protein [Cypionkella sp.]|nr:isoprenylcysteine carboxylmethyltransferase family protein [Cypionkella sp.]